MRSFFHFLCVVVIGAFLITVGLTVSHAQNEDVADDSAEERGAATLDTLYEDLRRQPDPRAAQRIANQIRDLWFASGSDTIDLLMQWSAEAIRDKKYPVAEDLLNQVIVLAPAYAEGWNRRATLYYSMNRYGHSLADIERTLQLEPRHYGALSGLASILSRTRQDQKALEAWRKVLEIYPANRGAQKAVIDLEEKLSGSDS